MYIIEQLESREVFTVNIIASLNAIFVMGDEGPNQIEVSTLENRLIISGDNETFSYDIPNILIINGMGGNDLIINSTNVQAALDGGEGNDTIMGGGALDFILGQEGDDNLAGSSYIGVLNGGAGFDMAELNSEKNYLIDIEQTATNLDTAAQTIYSSNNGVTNTDFPQDLAEMPIWEDAHPILYSEEVTPPRHDEYGPSPSIADLAYAAMLLSDEDNQTQNEYEEQFVGV